MLRIRKEQMEAFSRAALKNFEDRMVAYLNRIWPEQYQEMGEGAVRDTIRDGIECAAGYGVTKEYDVARYIDLMYAMGKDFDVNPRTMWAAIILNDPDLIPKTKMDRIYERAKKELGGNTNQ